LRQEMEETVFEQKHQQVGPRGRGKTVAPKIPNEGNARKKEWPPFYIKDEVAGFRGREGGLNTGRKKGGGEGKKARILEVWKGENIF